ncbi:MAG: molybdopterin-synthase adenylyltransferase MoeB [Ectothiorhodospiraceae bacterium]|nr:molybdopterin-synthase adenylyltransferase MoeB [Ectothiorhodospiraceae bacterium]MCH8503413.1 molybdopterin-synthase adenylyltransferase MoeB [Ectothiorhodospiraceae bacterium]
MNDEQLLRYSRQLMLPEVDMEGQLALSRARVLILGLGGLGSPAAMYLAAGGVGHLVLVDDDQVELSNLQRQIAHGTGDIGSPKVESAARSLRRLNPETGITTLPRRLDAAELERQVDAVDVVLDGSDNFETRFAVNAACVRTGTPLVSGAAIRLEGQLAVFRPDLPDRPCYACLFPPGGDQRLSCSENGVLAPVVGVIGSLQAVEAMRVITGFGSDDVTRLTLWDARTGDWQRVQVPKDPDCPVCGTGD